MAMSNKPPMVCKFGDKCNKGMMCPHVHLNQETFVSLNSPPSKLGDGKLPNFSNSQHNDNIRLRPRRPRSRARPLVATEHVTEPAFAGIGHGTPKANSANPVDNPFFQPQIRTDRSNTRNNGRGRSQSKSRRFRSTTRPSTTSESDTNSLFLPLSIDQIRKNIQDLYQKDILEARELHEIRITMQNALLDELSEDDETRPMKEALLQELKDQLETFNTIILSLSSCSPSTISEAQCYFDALKREIKRLKTHLPIYARRLDLIFTIASARVTIVKADTGSGKSTQLVQYLVDAGLADRGQIVCTQPRRLAARALASRVAEEFGCKVGEEVGFHVGASNPRVSNKTRILFVTDAVLLNEYHRDPKLKAYSIIIVDEAHERRVDTDLLFGIMKICLKERRDIKLIVMSATLDEDLFCNYYDDAWLIKVAGRTFPIEDEYMGEDPEDYVDAAIAKTVEIHASKESGDILVFLTGPDEINRAIEEVTEKIKSYSPAVILPLHGKLNEDETQAVFKPSSIKERKIIFSTNVAETSITIDGICHVVDSGMVKEVMWDPKRNMRALKIANTTQSSVKQRRGRAGRTAAGKCYHLYTLDTYESLDICPRAEILCTEPSMAVLKLKYLGVVDDVTKFQWLESPSNQRLQDAVVNLIWLGALDPRTGLLTDIGRTMAKLGLNPMLSAMILAGKRCNCLNYVLALAGMLSVAQNVWWRGKDDQSKQLGDEMRASFAQDSGIGGDHISLLRIFIEWHALGENKRNNRTWCHERMINGKSMKMADDFIREVAQQIEPNFKLNFNELNNEVIEQIVRCICTGFFQHLAVSNGHLRAGYQLMSGSSGTFARVHRSSTLTFAQEAPKFIIYHDILVLNETNYLTAICPVHLDWLYAPWLKSLPRAPSQCVLESYVFESLGPALLLSLVGKKCQNIPSLEESLGVFIQPDYKQSKLTVWGQSQKLYNARSYFQRNVAQQREKLRTEVQEFEIVGTTRILLGTGAEVQLTMAEDEYVKVLLNRLSTSITEEEILNKCQAYGAVRNVTMLQTNQSGSSALVTFDTCESARTAVTQLSHEIWNGTEINVNPSHIRTSIHAGRQNCKLKAYWFMTASECSGRVQFSQPDAATKAKKLFEGKNYDCRIHLNTTIPTIKCIWSLVPHTGKANIYFQNPLQIQKVLQCAALNCFSPQINRNNKSAICIRNVPAQFDEDDLKSIFTDCNNLVLMRGSKGMIFRKPPEAEDELRRLFHMYPSFQRESVIVTIQQKTGCLEGYVQFLDEREMQAAIREMNGKLNLVGSGKLRLSVYEQRTFNKKSNQTNKCDFVIKLFKLPPDIDEEALIQDLNQHQLGDYITNVYVARKTLPPVSSTNTVTNTAEENEINLVKLKSLFTDRNRFRSTPDIRIMSATNDGRVIAFILFNDPRDVTAAMELYEAPDDPDLLQFGVFKLRLIPVLDHTIELNSALARAIPNKIREAVERIKNAPEFSNLRLIQKVALKNNQEIIRISIKGTNILQIYKARTSFDELMKGLIFKFHKASWVSVIFDPKGKKFLQEVQDRTGTYIWWHWKSNLLRIFGEDQASRTAYQEIDNYIQKTLVLHEYSVSIPITEGRLRQCMQKASEFRELSNEKVKVIIDVMKRIVSVSGETQAVIQCEQNINNLLEKLVTVPVHFTATAWQTTKKMSDTQCICPICMCTLESPYSLQQCGHTLCRSCLMAYFETHFDATMTADAFKLCCPFDKCNVACLIRDIVSILGFEKATRLAMIAFKIHIRRPENDLVQCIGNNCDQVYRPSIYSSTYFCDQCIKLFCIPCKADHTGMTCKQYSQAEKERKDKALLETNLGDLPLKHCPKCRTLIEKYAGCNAMKCTQCTIAFCWLCSLTHDEDVHYHYNEKDSQCYNRCFDMTPNMQ